MGNAVTIRYPNGLRTHEVKRVEAIAGAYQEGHFDGMNDIYEMSNRRDDLLQVKFVHVQKDY